MEELNKKLNAIETFLGSAILATLLISALLWYLKFVSVQKVWIFLTLLFLSMFFGTMAYMTGIVIAVNFLTGLIRRVSRKTVDAILDFSQRHPVLRWLILMAIVIAILWVVTSAISKLFPQNPLFLTVLAQILATVTILVLYEKYDKIKAFFQKKG